MRGVCVGCVCVGGGGPRGPGPSRRGKIKCRGGMRCILARVPGSNTVRFRSLDLAQRRMVKGHGLQGARQRGRARVCVGGGKRTPGSARHTKDAHRMLRAKRSAQQRENKMV